MTETARRIETLLRERFQPLHLVLHDDSPAHAGHPGAADGGGHYHVLIVAQEFEGKTSLEQQRLVNEVLGPLVGREIHALALRTLAPSRWRKDG